MSRRVFAAPFALALMTAQTTASCLIVGDSIAVGTGEQLPGCVTDAKVGIPSAAIVLRVRPGFDWTIISSGSNDPDNPALQAHLEAARARATGGVMWILPRKLRAADLVRQVAARHGDPVVAFGPARDRIHPASYVLLARSVLFEMRRHEAER